MRNDNAHTAFGARRRGTLTWNDLVVGDVFWRKEHPLELHVVLRIDSAVVEFVNYEPRRGTLDVRNYQRNSMSGYPITDMWQVMRAGELLP